MRKSLKIYLIVIAAIVLTALLVTAGFACASHMSENQYTRKKEISIAYDIPVFYTESVWLSDNKTFCIVTQAGSSGVKNTLAFVKSSSGEWENAIFMRQTARKIIFLSYSKQMLSDTHGALHALQ